MYNLNNEVFSIGLQCGLMFQLHTVRQSFSLDEVNWLSITYEAQCSIGIGLFSAEYF